MLSAGMRIQRRVWRMCGVVDRADRGSWFKLQSFAPCEDLWSAEGFTSQRIGPTHGHLEA